MLCLVGESLVLYSVHVLHWRSALVLLIGQTRSSFQAELQDNTRDMVLRLGSVVGVAAFCLHALLLWFYAKVCGLLYRCTLWNMPRGLLWTHWFFSMLRWFKTSCSDCGKCIVRVYKFYGCLCFYVLLNCIDRVQPSSPSPFWVLPGQMCLTSQI